MSSRLKTCLGVKIIIVEEYIKKKKSWKRDEYNDWRVRACACPCVVNKQRSSRVCTYRDWSTTRKNGKISVFLARVGPTFITQSRQIDRVKTIGFRRREKFACLHYVHGCRHWYSSRISGCLTVTARRRRRLYYNNIVLGGRSTRSFRRRLVYAFKNRRKII